MISRNGRGDGLLLHLINPNHVFLPCKKKQKQNRPADLHAVKSMIMPLADLTPIVCRATCRWGESVVVVVGLEGVSVN